MTPVLCRRKSSVMLRFGPTKKHQYCSIASGKACHDLRLSIQLLSAKDYTNKEGQYWIDATGEKNLNGREGER